MPYKILIRAIADILLLIAILFLPWWIAVGLSFILFFALNRFYEFLAVYLFIDVLYATKGTAPFGFVFFFSMAGAFLFIMFSFLRERMRYRYGV